MLPWRPKRQRLISRASDDELETFAELNVLIKHERAEGAVILAEPCYMLRSATVTLTTTISDSPFVTAARRDRRHPRYVKELQIQSWGFTIPGVLEKPLLLRTETVITALFV